MKHVTVRTDSILGVLRNGQTSWADVWLRLKLRRRTLRLAPCICGAASAGADLDCAEALVKKYPGEAWASDDSEVARWVVDSLQANGYAVNNSFSTAMPELVTAAPLVDRTEAERLMELWLRDSLGIRGQFKFHWKRPRLICRQITPATPRAVAAQHGATQA